MEDYIKYSYEVEEIPENFDEYITTINNDIREYIKNTPNLSRATHHTRDAHANGYAVLKAEVEILDNLSEELAQGIYAKPENTRQQFAFPMVRPEFYQINLAVTHKDLL
jgi:myo-inositol-1-phosphate synthase